MNNNGDAVQYLTRLARDPECNPGHLAMSNQWDKIVIDDLDSDSIGYLFHALARKDEKQTGSAIGDRAAQLLLSPRHPAFSSGINRGVYRWHIDNIAKLISQGHLQPDAIEALGTKKSLILLRRVKRFIQDGDKQAGTQQWKGRTNLVVLGAAAKRAFLSTRAMPRGERTDRKSSL